MAPPGGGRDGRIGRQQAAWPQEWKYGYRGGGGGEPRALGLRTRKKWLNTDIFVYLLSLDLPLYQGVPERIEVIARVDQEKILIFLWFVK